MCNNVNCQYMDKCLSFKKKCGSCANNWNARRDYYQPMPYPHWWPCNPWPWYPQPNIWYTSVTGVQQSDGKCDYYSNNTDVPVSC